MAKKNKLFNSVQVNVPGRNMFDLSHYRKSSYNMGLLYPVLCQETVPGDKFSIKSDVFLRFAPLIAPIMHNVDVYMHCFKVPIRLIWSESENFFTGGEDGTSAPVPPYITISTTNVAAGKFVKGSLANHLGIPAITTDKVTDSSERISALPFRAYQLVYDEWYRNQNVISKLDISKASGEVTGAELNKITTLRKRSWEKDYFTSALAEPQRGPDVLIPIEAQVDEADINYKGSTEVYKQSGANAEAANLQTIGGGTVPNILHVGNPATPGRVENINSIDIPNVSSTIRDLRRAISLQNFLELMNRVGGRFTEWLKGVYGVTSSDARIQRPEYLGGGKAPVQITEVFSTAQFEGAESELPQGNLAGTARSWGSSNVISTYCEEPCYIIMLLSILPKPAYQQGIPRMFSRTNRYDFFLPQLENIGEQEIKEKELYYDPEGGPGDNDALFGYAPRYSEYKYQPDIVTGDFCDQLDFWHMGRIFTSTPVLNANFTEADPTERIFAVTDQGASDKIYCQIYHSVRALRPMQFFGTPRMAN